MNAILLRDDTNCKKPDAGVGKWAAIVGGVVFGLTVVIIIVVLVMLRFGYLRQTSYLMLAKQDDQPF